MPAPLNESRPLQDPRLWFLPSEIMEDFTAIALKPDRKHMAIAKLMVLVFSLAGHEAFFFKSEAFRAPGKRTWEPMLLVYTNASTTKIMQVIDVVLS